MLLVFTAAEKPPRRVLIDPAEVICVIEGNAEETGPFVTIYFRFGGPNSYIQLLDRNRTILDEIEAAVLGYSPNEEGR